MSKSGRKEDGESAEPITIGFGSIHTYAEDERLKYVVLDVGENGWFTASQIIGKRLGFPGTGSASDVGEVIGEMGYEEVLNRLRVTIGDTTNIEPTLKEYLQKPKRTLFR